MQGEAVALADKGDRMSDKSEHEPIDWKTHGVKVLPGDQLDPNTAQTAGMDRAAAAFQQSFEFEVQVCAYL